MKQDNNKGGDSVGNSVKQTRMDLCLEVWIENPLLPYDTIADMAGVGKKTFWRYRQDPDFMAKYHELQKQKFAALEGKGVALLEEQMDKGNWNAIKYVLDGTGYKATEKVETSGTTTINVSVGD